MRRTLDPLRNYLRLRDVWRLAMGHALWLVPIAGIVAIAWIGSGEGVSRGQLLSPIGIVVGSLGATFSLLFNVLANSRTLYYSKAANVEKVFINLWKEKRFSKPIHIDYRHLNSLRHELGEGALPPLAEPTGAERDAETRITLRNALRHAYFKETLVFGIDDGVEMPDPPSADEASIGRVFVNDRALWQHSLAALHKKKDAEAWEFRAVYELSSGLQDLGALVRGGTLPLDLVLVNGARLIIEDWMYIQDTVLYYFRRPETNMMLMPVRQSLPVPQKLLRLAQRQLGHGPGPRPVYGPAHGKDIKLGALRRHGEWLAMLACIYWTRTYTGGTTGVLIDAIESHYAAVAPAFSDDADTRAFLRDAGLLRRDEDLDANVLGRIPNIVYRERLLRAADLMVFGERSIRHLALDGLVGHSVHTQAYRAYSPPAA